MAMTFHFEVSEGQRPDLAEALAAADHDGTPRIRASCRWWRSWYDTMSHMLVFEGELHDDADAGVLSPFAKSSRPRCARRAATAAQRTDTPGPAFTAGTSGESRS
jgi:hypothetical protein